MTPEGFRRSVLSMCFRVDVLSAQQRPKTRTHTHTYTHAHYKHSVARTFERCAEILRRQNETKRIEGIGRGCNGDLRFGCIMFAYQKQKVCSCCGGGKGGGGGGGGGFFLVYVIGLTDPRPRLDENRRVRQCVTGERERGGREGENKAVKQLDRHLLGVYARL